MSRPLAGTEPAGPRPRPGRRRPRRGQGHRGPAWLLDHAFPLRLLLALVAAGALLGGVNRWENCRSTHFAHGCLFRDPGGIVTVANVEALSIVTAAFLYLLEGQQRRQRENLRAMEVILSCQQAGARLSLARNDALEALSAQGLWLDGLDLHGAVLDALQAPYGRWRCTNLRQASLQQACLHDTDLQGADLAGADLR
jgi:Pentapeptide repeats (8 copies)